MGGPIQTPMPDDHDCLEDEAANADAKNTAPSRTTRTARQNYRQFWTIASLNVAAAVAISDIILTVPLPHVLARINSM